MDLVNISRFLAVMNEKSFAKAAKLVGITPQAIAFSINKLEAELGIVLFNRESGGTTTPTDYAKLLESHAETLINDERRAFEAVRSMSEARSGWVRIGIGETMTGSTIANVISDLKVERPDVEIAIIESYTDDLVESLHAGDLDLVVGSPVTGVENSENLEQHALFEASDLIVARRAHPLANKKNVSLEDMQHFTWLVPYARQDTHSAILTAYLTKGLTPPSSFVFSDAPTVGTALMKRQDYLLLSPPDMVKVDEGGDMVRIDAAEPSLKRTAFLINLNDRPLSEIARVIRARIMEMHFE